MSTELEIAAVEKDKVTSSLLTETKAHSARTVLILDQEMMYRGHLRELIEQEDYFPMTFSDAYKMVRYIEKNQKDIKAVFIDAGIFAAIEKTMIEMVSHTGSRIRLILTNTELTKKHIRIWIKRGVYGCVVKPYVEDEISAFLH